MSPCRIPRECSFARLRWQAARSPGAAVFCVADVFHEEPGNPSSLGEVAQELGADSPAVNPLVRRRLGGVVGHLPGELRKLGEYRALEERMRDYVYVLTHTLDLLELQEIGPRPVPRIFYPREIIVGNA